MPSLALVLAAVLGSLSTPAAWAAPGDPEDLPEAFRDEPAVVLLDVLSWRWKTFAKSTQTVRKKILLRDRSRFDLANQQIVWDTYEETISDFSAKTILPDGREVEVPEVLIRDTILFDSDRSEIHSLHFTFPRVSEGAIIEWTYRRTEKNPANQLYRAVQTDIPVLDSYFDLQLGRTFAEQVEIHTNGVGPFQKHCTAEREGKRSVAKVLKFRCKAVPALPDEPARPPVNDVRLGVDVAFQVSRIANISSEHWERYGTRLSEGIREFLAGADFGPFIAELGLDASSPLNDRIDAVYLAVQDRFELVDRLPPDQATAAAVLKSGKARRGDLPILLLGALREIGVQPNYVAAPDRRGGSNIFGADVWNRMARVYLYVVVDGQERLLDPICSYCPPGIPDWRYVDDTYSSLVLPIAPGGPSRMSPLPAELNAEFRREEAHIAADGTARVSGRVAYGGNIAAGYRARWSDLPDRLRRDDFSYQLPAGFEDAEISFSGVDDVMQDLAVEYRVDGVQLPLTRDGRLFLQPPEAFARSVPIPLQEERQSEVWLPYRQMRRLEARYRLPATGRLARLPEDVSLRGKGLFFKSSWAQEADGTVLVWRGEFTVRRLRFEPDQYDDTREFLFAMRRALREGVIVENVAGETGAQAASR